MADQQNADDDFPEVSRIKLRMLRAEKQPQVTEAIRDAEQKLRAILNAEQQKKFDEIAAKTREKWEGK